MSKWLIERAGVQITVNAETPDSEELVKSVLKGMQLVPIEESRGIELTVSDVMREQGRTKVWRLWDDSNDSKRNIVNTGDLVYHLTDRIIFHFADKAEKAHCLHAAAVAMADNAIVIPANSGAGKSSFTAWLVANGFAYMTDELILINEGGDHRISGVARPIQIKSHGIDAVKPLLKHDDFMYFGKIANPLLPEGLGGVFSDVESHNLSMFIFPQYRKDSEFEFKKISGAEAGMALMGNYVNARNLEGHGFREMMSIIRKVPCYSLEYGGFDKLPTNFEETLKSIIDPKATGS